MTKYKKYINIIIISGILFCLPAGVFLHFLYEWTNKSIIVSVISAVNESIWEHIKLTAVPIILFIVVGSFTFGKKVNNFYPAMSLGLHLGWLFIPIFYYAYTGIIGKDIIFIDILIYILSIIICFIFARFLMIKRISFKTNTNILLTTLTTILIVMLVIFTFKTPKIPLFQDPSNGTYGILMK